MYANVTGTPASCICATSASVFFGNSPSKPGKPHWLNWSVTSFVPVMSLTQALPPVIAGFTYFEPNSAWKPV